MFKQIVLVTLFAVGCAQPVEQLAAGSTLYVDANFSAAEAEAVALAVIVWNEAIPALDLRVAYTAGPDWEILRQADSLGAYGVARAYEPLIIVDPDLIASDGRPETEITSVVAHELGHAIGWRSEHAATGLMTAKSSHLTCIDATTLAAICNARPELCDGSERPTCG